MADPTRTSDPIRWVLREIEVNATLSDVARHHVLLWAKSCLLPLLDDKHPLQRAQAKSVIVSYAHLTRLEEDLMHFKGSGAVASRLESRAQRARKEFTEAARMLGIPLSGNTKAGSEGGRDVCTAPRDRRPSEMRASSDPEQ
jgi:hypothetical protein